MGDTTSPALDVALAYFRAWTGKDVDRGVPDDAELLPRPARPGGRTTFTPLLVAYEPQVRELLEIPYDFITACHIVAGYPERGFPKKLRRRPVEEIAVVDTFGAPLTLTDAAEQA
jgi:hypothetical protein